MEHTEEGRVVREDMWGRPVAQPARQETESMRVWLLAQDLNAVETAWRELRARLNETMLGVLGAAPPGGGVGEHPPR